MKLVKQNKSSKGHGTTYISECGMVKAVLHLSSRSYAIKDGRWTVGRGTCTTRFYNVLFHSSLIGLNTNEFINVFSGNIAKTLKDVQSHFESMKTKTVQHVEFSTGEHSWEAYYLEGVTEETKENHKVTEYSFK